MAKGLKLGRTVGWAAGVGISNWVLQRRRVATTKSAPVQVPARVLDVDMKAEVYRLRGETVSIGGMVEWIIATLAGSFAQSKQKSPRRQWKDLRRRIKSKGLKADLLAEWEAVNGYFKPRNLAAHAGIITTGVAEATQVFRFFSDKGNHRVELVNLEDLEEEAAIARAGYEAIRSIGRTLDDNEPNVLGDMDVLTKAMLLGRT